MIEAKTKKRGAPSRDEDEKSDKPSRKRGRSSDMTGRQIADAIDAAGGISPFIYNTFRKLSEQRQKKYAEVLESVDKGLADEMREYMTRTKLRTMFTKLSNRFDECPELDVVANVLFRNKLPVVRFGSGMKMPNAKLSNFYTVPVRVRAAHITESSQSAAIQAAFPNLERWLGSEGRVFPSSEHAYQSLKAADEATFLQFTEGGALAAWPTATMHPFAASSSAKDRAETFNKFNKSNKPMIGILAKMAVTPDRAERLGLRYRNARGLMEKERWQSIEKALWLDIVLRAKYDPNGPAENRALYEFLLCTGDAYLLEFGRGARSDHFDPRKTDAYWNGALFNLWGSYISMVGNR